MGSTTTSDGALTRLAMRVGRELLARNQRVVTAESCTGGWIAKALTDVAGSSEWFEAGMVVYSNKAKQQQLGVARAMLVSNGAVSEAVVRSMAKGALRKSGADVAVAVSGIAGPGGATPGKPVGTVWFCWATRSANGMSVRSEVRYFLGNREMVRRKTVHRALQGLRSH
jgi:nicotinamide-nucleotide amidase